MRRQTLPGPMIVVKKVHGKIFQTFVLVSYSSSELIAFTVQPRQYGYQWVVTVGRINGLAL